jgi:hypothetical protein
MPRMAISGVKVRGYGPISNGQILRFLRLDVPSHFPRSAFTVRLRALLCTCVLLTAAGPTFADERLNTRLSLLNERPASASSTADGDVFAGRLAALKLRLPLLCRREACDLAANAGAANEPRFQRTFSLSAQILF